MLMRLPATDREISRKSYTMKQKKTAVRLITAMVDEGSSVSSACRSVRIERGLFYRWKKVVRGESDTHLKKARNSLALPATAAGIVTAPAAITALEGMPPSNVPPVICSQSLLRGHIRSRHRGRQGVLESKETELLQWIFEHREQGIQVTTRMVRNYALKILPELRQKSRSTNDQAVRRFLHKIGLTHRVSTHVSQKCHMETEDAALDFMEFMRRKVENMNPDHVLNMDQTPIPFTFHAKRTWETKGVRTVHVHGSTSETKRATLAATVTMSGELLPPFLIFKGAQNGRIAKTELGTFPEMGFYAMQCKAWMDESMMSVWIEKCLLPWKETLPPGVTPLLILDSFRVHMMGSVVEKIQGIGIEVQYIPGGCTYLCQPIDVGVNKPIKNKMADKWEDWLEEEEVQNGKALMTPSRELIASWVVETYWMLDAEKCKNVWRKKGFEWVAS